MIRRVRGTLVGREPDAVEVRAADGIGYEIHVPRGLADGLPDEGAEVELHTTLVVRDDALELFGFGSARDRELFARLRTVKGVGPRVALSVLGALPGGRVVEAIRSRDHKALQTVSGVGRKTAERIALELADKLDDLGGAAPVPSRSSETEAAVRALRALGYGQAESDEAVRRAARAHDGRKLETEELVKRALQFV